MNASYTSKQGRYLAFLHLYTRLNNRPPAEADFEAFFKTSPAAIHQMILTLEKQGWIERTPGQARSLRLLLPPEQIPDLDTGKPPKPTLTMEEKYPNIAFWIRDGSVDIGWCYYTKTFLRAILEDNVFWEGGRPENTKTALPTTRWFSSGPH
jgi:SOS-response transcriptional repressor LexA